MMIATLVLALCAAVDVDLYDQDPGHPWNRLHAALLADEVPATDADAFLWGVGDEELAKRTLSDFLDADADRRVETPIARALLQRDLWAVFDRTDPVKSRRLKAMLAAAIKRLALTAEQIEALPAADADGDVGPLLAGEGPWVGLRDTSWGRDGLLTPAHEEVVAHRSAFSVHLALPDGRDGTLAYLEQLRAGVWLVPSDDGVLRLDPDAPQVPVGTRVALVRRALLVDVTGEPVVSPLVEKVQIREFDHIVPDYGIASPVPPQSFAVHSMDRRALLAGSITALRPVDPEESIVNFFANRYMGRATLVPAALGCAGCHGGAGIFSVNTWKRDATGCNSDALENHRHGLPRRLVEDGDGWSDRLAVAAKKRHATYGELRALW